MRSLGWIGLAALLALAPLSAARAADNLLQDGSFELTKPADQFGQVFAEVGRLEIRGRLPIRGGPRGPQRQDLVPARRRLAPKIRMAQDVELQPGRYKITAFIRGLDIGKGTWGGNTEFMFDGKYMRLEKNGTFGWTKLTYVGELKEKKKAGPSFGLMAPGYFWIDDVTLEKVGDDVPLTEKPVLGKEEAPIAPPGEIGARRRPLPRVRLPEHARVEDLLRLRHAAGGEEGRRRRAGREAHHLVRGGEDPFDGGTVVAEHATDGKKALRLDKN